MRFHCLLTAIFSLITSSPNLPPEVLAHSVVNFRIGGPASVQAIVSQGDHPHLLFQSRRTDQLLLDAKVGKSSLWKEYVDRLQPNGSDMGLRFVVLHRAGLPDPLIVALARMQGGSDCAYNSALFGEVNGQLSELTPSLPDHWSRGQALLSAGSSNGSITLTISSERYQTNDVHADGPSQMAVYLYGYSPSQGKFLEMSHTEVKSNDLHLMGEDLAALFGAFAQC